MFYLKNISMGSLTRQEKILWHNSRWDYTMAQDAFWTAEAEAALSSIGNEHRLEILRVLVEAQRERDLPLPFSKIRTRVEIDDPGQLGYHLRQLTGKFIRHTDDGYALRTAGKNVVRAILSGTFADHQTRTFEAPGECPHCEAAGLHAKYDDEWLLLRCDDCDTHLTVWSFPSGGATNRDDALLLMAFDQWVRQRIALARDGVCPECGGVMRFTETTTAFADAWPFDVLPVYRCRHCYEELCPSFGMTLLTDTSVRSFYREHGIELTEIPFWRLDFCVDDRRTEILSTDPLSVVVSFELDEQVLTVELDDSLSVVARD